MGINNAGTNAQCIQFDETYGVHYPSISGVEGGGTAIYNTYGISSTPTFILIAPNHQIIEQDMGPIFSTQDFTNYFEANGIQQAECEESHNEVILKAFLEGPFITNQMTPWLNTAGHLPLSQPYNIEPWNYVGTESVPFIPNSNIVDWVLVELRETTGTAIDATSNTVVAKQAAFILKNGSIVGMDGSSNLFIETEIIDNLFAVIWHRNHLGIMSANPLASFNNSFSYNFSSSSDQAFGGLISQKQIGNGIWGMVSGNGLPDDQLNNNDKNDIWTLQYGTAGYWTGDFDMNGQVDSDDKVNLWAPNIGKGSLVPQ